MTGSSASAGVAATRPAATRELPRARELARTRARELGVRVLTHQRLRSHRHAASEPARASRRHVYTVMRVRGCKKRPPPSLSPSIATIMIATINLSNLYVSMYLNNIFSPRSSYRVRGGEGRHAFRSLPPPTRQNRRAPNVPCCLRQPTYV